MSTSPDDEIVNVLSRWLARHVDDGELRDEVAAIGTGELTADQAEAVDELLVALRNGAPRGELEVAVRETLEALALG
ncbi:MAG: hypothetical protein E6G08_01885 [Actinobacteria bacterium]|nr:MAG: hypothetical protein E6G08_01885 [Actinomycetota bacterium]